MRVRVVLCPGGSLGCGQEAGVLSSGWTLTPEFIQINEMKAAGSPDLVTAIHSLVVNNLCNKGLWLQESGGGCGPALPWRLPQELKT